MEESKLSILGEDMADVILSKADNKEELLYMALSQDPLLGAYDRMRSKPRYWSDKILNDYKIELPGNLPAFKLERMYNILENTRFYFQSMDSRNDSIVNIDIDYFPELLQLIKLLNEQTNVKEVETKNYPVLFKLIEFYIVSCFDDVKKIKFLEFLFESVNNQIMELLSNESMPLGNVLYESIEYLIYNVVRRNKNSKILVELYFLINRYFVGYFRINKFAIEIRDTGETDDDNALTHFIELYLDLENKDVVMFRPKVYLGKIFYEKWTIGLLVKYPMFTNTIINALFLRDYDKRIVWRYLEKDETNIEDMNLNLLLFRLFGEESEDDSLLVKRLKEDDIIEEIEKYFINPLTDKNDIAVFWRLLRKYNSRKLAYSIFHKVFQLPYAADLLEEDLDLRKWYKEMILRRAKKDSADLDKKLEYFEMFPEDIDNEDVIKKISKSLDKKDKKKLLKKMEKL